MARARAGCLIPVAGAHDKYAEEVRQKLLEQDIRVETYGSSETLGKRVRNAEHAKVPYMLVLGDKEVESDSVCHPPSRQPRSDYGEIRHLSERSRRTGQRTEIVITREFGIHKSPSICYPELVPNFVSVSFQIWVGLFGRVFAYAAFSSFWGPEQAFRPLAIGLSSASMYWATF